MEISEIIFFIAGLAGTAALLSAIVLNRTIKRSSVEVVAGHWKLNKILLFLLLVCYVSCIALLLLNMKEFVSLVSGISILLSAFYIVNSVLLSRTLLNLLQSEKSAHSATEGKLKGSPLIDQLTGLHNRKGVFNSIDNHLKLAKRRSHKVLLLYVDIDNLKGINNHLGHQEGDMMLKETANLLRTTFRESDLIARIGEDEFMVFPVGATDEHIDIINDNFRKKLETHNMNRNQKFKLSVSTVMVPYDPRYNDSFDTMLEQASEMMTDYKRRKKAGLLDPLPSMADGNPI